MAQVTVLADQPELIALGQLAAVAPSKMAAAFNDPEHFFEHLDLEELGRLQAAGERLALVEQAMTLSMDIYIEQTRRLLEAQAAEVPDAD